MDLLCDRVETSLPEGQLAVHVEAFRAECNRVYDRVLHVEENFQKVISKLESSDQLMLHIQTEYLQPGFAPQRIKTLLDEWEQHPWRNQITYLNSQQGMQKLLAEAVIH